MSTQLSQITRKATCDRKVRFTSLAHLLTPEFLKETWGQMNRRAAGGIDRESCEQFESELEQRFRKSTNSFARVRTVRPRCGGLRYPKGREKSG
jgi:RNA-directed DNA polymerase